MQVAFFIAKRLIRYPGHSFSRTIIRIAALAVTLSVTIMILGSAITRGYQQVIRAKFYDGWGHLHITPFLADPQDLGMNERVRYDSLLVDSLRRIRGIRSVQGYGILSCLLKNEDEQEGLLLKGIECTTAGTPFRQYLTKGSFLHAMEGGCSDELLVSASLSSKLHLQPGSSVLAFFVTEAGVTPKARKMRVAGIYKTGLEEYDQHVAICDLRFLQHIRDNDLAAVNGYELYLEPGVSHEAMTQYLSTHLVPPPLRTYQIETRFATVFSWLSMMRTNERLILFIMIFMAVINMTTAFLILVLERTRMIGILQTLGMQAASIQQVFILAALAIVLGGMLGGTVLGLGIGYMQQRFGWIHLDENIYYISSMPVAFDAAQILLINLLALGVNAVLLLIPSLLIRKLSPAKAIRFT